MEFWRVAQSIAGHFAEQVQTLEADGWDGVALTENQTDCLMELAIAAHATSTLKLGTGVTNLMSRHPSIIAAAFATLQVESGGRAMLGLGRGDGAMARIAMQPPSVNEFRRRLEQVQAYLRGDTVVIDGHESRLDQIPGYGPIKVPVSVAATGPRMIEVAATVGDRVTFSLGATVERLRWAIEHAREARRAVGMDPSTLSFGAYLCTAAHPDIKQARELVRNVTLTHFRFSIWDPATTATLAPEDREVADRLIAAYGGEREWHVGDPRGATQVAALDDAFIDRFAIVGTSDQVARRLRELEEIGIDHVMVMHYRGEPDTVREASQRFAREVIPQLR